MKSALGNIGENEKSRLAAELENAGINEDTTFIFANAEHFVKELEALAENMKHIKNTDEKMNVLESDEDRLFLIEQLCVIEAACNDYDDTAANAALDRLKEKSWSAETSSVLENIHEKLFLHSDFEKAGELAKEYTEAKRP
jgi:hypothetical protein